MSSFDISQKLSGFAIAKTNGFNPNVQCLDRHHEPKRGGYDLHK